MDVTEITPLAERVGGRAIVAWNPANLPWQAATAQATDALGKPVRATVRGRKSAGRAV